MEYEEALRYMSGLIRFGWKLGNERFEALCERLGRPQDRYTIVHIGGTKGKGSTTALAGATLQQAGYVVGTYFSPYVYDVCERVQVNGEMIARADFARLVAQIRPHIEHLAQTELGQTTEFELKTAIAFLHFAERAVDYACIEVGIGGRLDATNIVQPTVTVITNVDLDHTEILGDTHARIAEEKAGILKPGVPCFTAAAHPDALEVIARVADRRGVPLAFVRRGEACAPTGAADAVHWDVALSSSTIASTTDRVSSTTDSSTTDSSTTASSTTERETEHTAPVSIATPTRCYRAMPMRMGGVYQRANAACAVAAAERALAARGAALAERTVKEALATTAIPGRLMVIRIPNGPLVVLDGAHNALAAQALAGPVAALRAQHASARLFLVIGMVGGHDPEGVLAALAPGAERCYACQPNWKRAQPATAIAEVARRFVPHVEVIPSVPHAAQAAITAAAPDDMILITGSLYMVGEVPLDSLSTNQEAALVR